MNVEMVEGYWKIFPLVALALAVMVFILLIVKAFENIKDQEREEKLESYRRRLPAMKRRDEEAARRKADVAELRQRLEAAIGQAGRKQ
ncbi:hypothetical protein [Pantoea agglomerans]|uniref:hypothetical protein n=1 Tax=Enterobacter agglomerans TaxID=549 RepID=UPI000DAD95E8|nr:hypothetical protein [Pantoea agglomerans]RAH26343.1 hypothetical protein DOT37_23905 [Pantoea agglomerans]TGX88199.1 hypothetical protein E5821_23875 [Pantoea agglomerans]